MRFPFKISPDKTFDCTGFGENACDYLLLAPRFPVIDSKTALIENVETSGGQVASCIVGLARLGLKTRYIGRFGADEAGARGHASLIGEAIDLSFAETIKDARTHTSYILIDAQTATRTILFARDERLAYADGEAPLRAVADTRVLHIDGQNPRAALPLIVAARNADCLISADFDFVNDDIIALLPHVDILISSRDFPRRATGIEDDGQALLKLKTAYGCPLVGLTRGAEGALMLFEDSFIEQAASPVKTVDTTGAGDAFHAGFLYGLLTNKSIEDAMRIAAAVAALACRRLGARDGLPTGDELNNYLQAGNADGSSAELRGSARKRSALDTQG